MFRTVRICYLLVPGVPRAEERHRPHALTTAGLAGVDKIVFLRARAGTKLSIKGAPGRVDCGGNTPTVRVHSWQAMTRHACECESLLGDCSLL